MTYFTCDLIWVKQILEELGFYEVKQMKMYYDNQVVLHIILNLMFHKKTKHITIDSHFIPENLLSKEIRTDFVKSNYQLTNTITKNTSKGNQIEFIYSKLDVYNLYALEGTIVICFA